MPVAPYEFWVCLERLRHVSGVAASWRKHLGEKFDLFRAAFLNQRAEPARFYPCPRDCGCAHEVVSHGPGELVAVCRCETGRCGGLALTKEDILVWELSWGRLARALGHAFGLESQPAETGLRRTWQVGAWSSDAVLVFLTAQPAAQSFYFVVMGLAARLRRPFILLAPTVRHCDIRAQELLAGAGALCVGLDGCVDIVPPSELRVSRAPGELFAPLTPQPREALEESAARSAFALVRALDAGQPVRKAPLYTVFRLYCVEGLTVEQVARRCRCARSLVFSRLEALRRKLGAPPRQFRQYSSHFERLEDSMAEPRARRVRRENSF